jgi:tetratricopeptide (TPR) repeat protein
VHGVIDWKATVRRWFLIGISLLIAILLLRGQISMMLLDRGDIAAYARDGRASMFYERALAVDPSNAAAADRLMFQAILSHDKAILQRAVRIGDDQLMHDGHNETVRMDRALCLQLLGRRREAMTDFAAVGRATGDPRALLFAADDAAKLMARDRARELLRVAVRLDPRFKPARVALGRFTAAP